MTRLGSSNRLMRFASVRDRVEVIPKKLDRHADNVITHHHDAVVAVAGALTAPLSRVACARL